MKCAKAEELMSLRLDGCLDEAQARALADHLSGCERCAEEWRGFERLAGLLEGWPAAPCPAGLKGRILAAGGSGGRAMRPRWLAVARRAAAVVAAAVVVGALAVILTRREEAPQPETRRVAAPEPEVEVAPVLPPEIAELCVKLSPAAGEAVMDLGRQVATSLADATDRLTAQSSKIPGHFGRLSGRFMDESVGSLMRGVDRAFRVIERRGKDDEDAPTEGGLPGKDAVFAMRVCRRDVRPASPGGAAACC